MTKVRVLSTIALVAMCLAAGVTSLTAGTSTQAVAVSRAPNHRTASNARYDRVASRPALTISASTLHFPAPPVQARAAYLVDESTGSVLFSKDADTRLPMASTTKITTAILTIQHGHLGDLATVSQNAATIGESTMVLHRGERLRVRDLLYGLMLNSANDAAITLAEHVAGSVPAFVAEMNQLAHRLHMRNTHYMTPHGLDVNGHYSSAHDLAIIARYAMRNPLFRQIVSTGSYHIPATRHNKEHWLANINYPLFWFPGVDGVKPGDTDNAGFCQVISAWRNGRHLLAVVMNTPTLVNDIRNLLDFGARDFRWVQAPAYWDVPSNSISGGIGGAKWRYYFGAGHYIRGLFLSYFDAHGGLQTFGYPRTEELEDQGQWAQFYQGGELVYDPAHGTIYPQPLGAQLAPVLGGRAAIQTNARVASPFTGLFKRLGGVGVLGPPVTGTISVGDTPVQVFRYDALALQGGVPVLMPLGDAELRLRGLLPAPGTGNVHPLTISPRTALWARSAAPHPPPPPKSHKKRTRHVRHR